MPRFNVHGTPRGPHELFNATVIVTLPADDDAHAERLANLICPMDVSEIECAECSMPLEDCGCGAGIDAPPDICHGCGEERYECSCGEAA